MTANATPLSESEKKDFIESGFASCFSEQRKNPDNKEVTDSELKKYCYCYIKKSAELISREDLVLFMKNSSINHMQKSFNSASAYCAKEVILKEYFDKSQSSVFEKYNLKQGISIEIPKHWKIIDKQIMNQIDTNTELNTGIPQGNNDILIAASYVVNDKTLATARISVRIKDTFTQNNVKDMAQSDLDEGDNSGWNMAINGLKKMGDNSTKISKFITTKEMLAGFICTHTKYQRIEPYTKMNTSIYVIYLGDRAVKMTLSYEDSQAQLLKSTIDKIKQSLTVKI